MLPLHIGNPLRVVLWLLCIAWSLVWLAIYFQVMAKAETAIQEAAAGGFCVPIIVGYVCCRALDTMLRTPLISVQPKRVRVRSRSS